MTKPAPHRARDAAALGSLIAIGLWFWWGCLDDFFAQDDFLLLYDAARGAGFWTALFDVGAVDNMYRPLSTTVYFRVMHGLFGLSPLPYHMVNLALHISCALLVYGLLRQLAVNRVLSWAAALCVLTRSLSFVLVYWVAGVQPLMMCALCLLSAVLGLRYMATARRRDLIGSVIACGLAVASKGDVLVFPACAWLLGMIYGERRRNLTWCMCLGVVSVVFFGLHAAITAGHEKPYDFGPPQLNLLAKYLDWTAFGLPGEPNHFTLAVIVLPLIVLAPVVLGRSQDKWRAPLLFLGGCVLAAPSLMLQHRAATYYACLPAVFFIAALAVALTGVASTDRTRMTLTTLACIFVFVSVWQEYTLNQRKDDSPIAVIGRRSDLLPSGGWLNVARREQYQHLLANYQQERPVRGVVLVGWPELYVAGRAGDGSGRLIQASPTELMARLFGSSPEVEMRFLSDSPQHDHDLSAAQLPAFISRHDRDVLVLELHPEQATVRKSYDMVKLPDSAIIGLR